MSHTDISLNLLWVVIGAVLVIFMQAGLRAGRDRLLPGEARRPRRVDELRDLRPRVRRVLPRRLRRSCSAASAAPGRSGSTTAGGEPSLIGSGNWVFLWKGGFFLQGHAYDVSSGCVLPLHGRVHGHDRDHPDRRHGRAVEVERVRRLGLVLRRDLLPAVRRRGPGAAAGSPSSVRARAWATATSTSPVPASCT